MKIFVSWSGEMSKKIAQSLKKWLPMIIQAADVFYSPEDIEKGEIWDNKLVQELSSCNYGIICLTSENMAAPWIHFEAGAIAKTLESRVSTLLVNIKPSDIKGPLSRYQGTKLEKNDFSQLIMDINKNIEVPLEKGVLESLINALWPSIESEFTEIKQSAPAEEQKAPQKDINEPIEEILQLLRKQNSLLSNPEELLPIPYFEYLQKQIFSGNNRRTEEIIIEIFRFLDEFIDGLERHRDDYNIQILDTLRFDIIFDILLRYFERSTSRSAEKNSRRILDMRDHYYYIMRQSSRVISE